MNTTPTLEEIERATPSAFYPVLARLRLLFGSDVDMGATIPWEDLNLTGVPATWSAEEFEALGDYLEELISARDERTTENL